MKTQIKRRVSEIVSVKPKTADDKIKIKIARLQLRRLRLFFELASDFETKPIPKENEKI